MNVDSCVVIYGAGKVGRAYVRNLEKTNYARVIAWVDRAYDKYSDLGERISSPVVILEICFDYLIIAIEDEKIVKTIYADLESMGVPKYKIVWKRPERL